MVTNFPRSAACSAAEQPATPVPITRRSMLMMLQKLSRRLCAPEDRTDSRGGKLWAQISFLQLELIV